MANPEHLKILTQGWFQDPRGSKQGADAWNEWRRKHSDVRPDFRNADLTWDDLSFQDLLVPPIDGTDLHEADFSNADLRGVKLVKAILQNADLRTADLRTADLSWTVLCEADFSNADLRWADFTHANLEDANLGGANLIGARLSGANLSRVRLNETVFGDTDIREVMGLESCQHEGPSTLDHRTLAKSGRLPIAFLRGCGLPDQFIEYLPSLFHQAIQFYSCFISYSTKDQEFAGRLHADLQNNGVRCWFAPHDIAGGKKIHDQIDEAIRLYDRLLLILSPDSMNSEWVRTEISKARKRELREARRMLFPVRLVKLHDWESFDADTGKDSAREIREYFISDFSNWKDDDQYKIAFGRLLQDIKTRLTQGISEK